MGQISEMMLDGTLCECCGVYIDDEIPGIPRYCSRQCAKDRGALPVKLKSLTVVQKANNANPNLLQKKVTCPVCQKKVKAVGLADHMKAVHPGVPI